MELSGNLLGVLKQCFNDFFGVRMSSNQDNICGSADVFVLFLTVKNLI